jgi:hypothetical protein
MAQSGVVEVAGLPAAPIDAAARFHSAYVDRVRELMPASDVAVVFPAAGHEHRAWRLAAIQELAREAAPYRVNGISGDDPKAIGEALDFLAVAPGITGQLLAVGANTDAND